MNGAMVSCVLGSSDSSANSAAANLGKYGIKAEGYSDFSAMVDGERPDAVAIASPADTHPEYIGKCLEAGVHIFCEKPLVPPDLKDQSILVDTYFKEANERSLVISLNSQWPFCLPFYENLCGKLDSSRIENFYIRLSPLSSGREMIPDSVPHALSLLHFVAGSGEIRDLSFAGDDNSLTIGFLYLTQYGSIDACLELVRETMQPRTFSFGFNGEITRRVVDPESYTIYLTHDGKIIKIADPLELCICDFLDAVSSGREPTLGRRHIVDTAALLEQIYTAYMNE